MTSVIDNGNNVIEMVLKVKKNFEEKNELNLLEQLAKLFPDTGEKITEENNQKINQLPFNNSAEILSEIDRCEVPKQFEFFKGGISPEFETKAQTIGLSSDSIEFLDFLQLDICEDLLKNNKHKIHV